MGRIGHDDFAPRLVAACVVIGTYNHQSRQFAMRTRKRIEGELGHTADFRQRPLQCVIQLQISLNGIIRSGRMHIDESLVRSHLLVDFRIIFHCARTQGIEPCIDTEIVCRHIVVVAHNGQFVALRQTQRLLAQQCVGDYGRLLATFGMHLSDMVVGQPVAAPSGTR